MDTIDSEPLELAPPETLQDAADDLGVPYGMMRLLRRCPGCRAAILACDNGVWLDAKPAEETGPLVMGVMQMGTFSMACSRDGGGGSAHTMHEHQPPET